MSRLREWFTEWEIRKVIVSPIMVNLITALIIFVSVVAFKERVLTLLGIWKGVEGYPIYCVVEPYSVPRKDNPDLFEVNADLFIINLEDKTFSGPETLAEELKKIVGPELASRMSTAIKLRWKEDMTGLIRDIKPQKEFNARKGRAIARKLDDKTWEISINWIKERGILKLTVVTSWQAKYITRASRQSVPFWIDYPGRK